MIFLLSGSIFGQETPSSEVGFSGCWSYPVTSGAGTRLAGDSSNLFVGHRSNRIEALSNDGTRLWESDFGGEISSNLVVTDNSLFLVTRNSLGESAGNRSQLRSLSRSTGITVWTIEVTDAEEHFLEKVGETIILASMNGIVRSIDPANGEQRWKREIANSFLFAPAFDDTRLAVASGGDQVFLISIATGEIESLFRIPFRVTALDFAPGNSIFVGDVRGNVSRFSNGLQKAVWTMKTGAAVSSIIAVNDRVLVASNDNFVYFLGADKGSVQWKRRYSGRIGFSLALLNRYSLVSSFNDNGAFLTDLATGKAAGQIVLGVDENIVVRPLAVDSNVFLVSNSSTHAFSMNGCQNQSKGRTASSDPAR